MRWREIKQGKNQKQKEPGNENENYATYPQRIKALIVDLFMIYMPILYVMTYFVLEGKDDFQNSTFAPLVAWSIYGLIYAILLARSGQTPGKRAYDIKVVKANGQNLSFILSVARYILFLFSATILIGVLLPLFRKDKKALHDLILNTKEIDVS
jgi:uncharacterized RDD family membrane protein YckC